jgi:hypothetical protein
LRFNSQFPDQSPEPNLPDGIEAHGAVFGVEIVHNDGFQFTSEAMAAFEQGHFPFGRRVHRTVQPRDSASHDRQIVFRCFHDFSLA